MKKDHVVSVLACTEELEENGRVIALRIGKIAVQIVLRARNMEKEENSNRA